MPWFRVDDGFHSHPKRLSVSLAAVGLWTVAGSWSSAHLTDGVVPDAYLESLSKDAPMLAGELVAAGLWKRRRGGYQFRNWEDYQPTKEAVENDRRKNAQRQQRHRKRHSAWQAVEENFAQTLPTKQAVDNREGVRQSVNPPWLTA